VLLNLRDGTELSGRFPRGLDEGVAVKYEGVAGGDGSVTAELGATGVGLVSAVSDGAR
jgi:hypothetical protein